MAEWPLRVMIYGAGQAINGANALSSQILSQVSQLARVATNRYVAAIAQLDASPPPSLRYVLDPLGRQTATEFADINTGNPDELIDFVDWAAAVCPAMRTVLVLSGHGAAWEDSLVGEILGTRVAPGTRAVPPAPGAIHHARRLFGAGVSNVDAITRAVLIDGSNRDYLANAELGAACDRIVQDVLHDRLDVLVFDACLMSAWEILHELSGSVRVVIAAVDELSSAGIDLARPVYRLSAAGGRGSAHDIGVTVVRQFEPRATFDSCVAVGVVDSEWATGIGHFRVFCNSLLRWIENARANADAARAALRAASTSIVKFNGGGLADVRALATEVANIPNPPAAAVRSIRMAAESISSCVLARVAGRDYQSAIGISVFSPPSGSIYASNRPDYIRLRFANDTGWSRVLDSLYF